MYVLVFSLYSTKHKQRNHFGPERETSNPLQLDGWGGRGLPDSLCKTSEGAQRKSTTEWQIRRRRDLVTIG